MRSSAYIVQSGINILIYEELSQVLRGLRNAGIDVLIFKGAALAETVYRHIGMRKMSDVDMLVRKKDLVAAQEIIVELGYKLKQGSQLFYTKKNTIPVSIDLHSEIFSFLEMKLRRRIMDMIWSEAIPANIAGEEVRVMSPEDTIIYGAVHMSVNHGLTMDKWLKDIDAVVRHYKEIDWNKVLDRAKICHVKIMLYHVLRRVVNWYKTFVPDYVFESLSPGKSDFLFNKIFETVIYQEKNISSVDYLLPVLACRGLSNKVKLMLAYVFPSREMLMIRYGLKNTSMVFMYYFIRPFALIAKGMEAMVSLCWRTVSTG
jgi:hypothetical protein